LTSDADAIAFPVARAPWRFVLAAFVSPRFVRGLAPGSARKPLEVLSLLGDLAFAVAVVLSGLGFGKGEESSGGFMVEVKGDPGRRLAARPPP